jgi:aminopeptidase N
LANKDDSIFERIRRDHEFAEKNLHRDGFRAASIVTTQSANPQPIDVKHYRLQIRLSPDVPAIAGTVKISAETRAQVAAISIDAEANLMIDAVRLDGCRETSRERIIGSISASPNRFNSPRSFEVAIDYHGIPIINFWKEDRVARHPAGGVPVGEPQRAAAPTWWPCIDDPTGTAESKRPRPAISRGPTGYSTRRRTT